MRAKIGDLIEIPTSKGIFYAIYTHKHKVYGDLIDVISPEICDANLEVSKLSRKNFIISCFTPLGRFLKSGFGKVIGNKKLSDDVLAFPTFKVAVEDPATGKVQGKWWLWDGEQEWRVGELTSEQRDFPLRGVWGAELLIKRLEEGWVQRDYGY